MEMRYYEEGMVKKVVCVFRGWGVQGKMECSRWCAGLYMAVSARLLPDFLFRNGRQNYSLFAV